MTDEQIISLQRTIGTTPDGFWGPQSTRAARLYLKRRRHADTSLWPRTDQASLTAFYGAPGDESRLVNLDVAGLGVQFANRDVQTIRCHAKVAPSLKRILLKLSKSHPELLARYAGCYANRSMRGSSTPSLHARGAAIDLYPEQNANHAHWPVAAQMPIEVMVTFAEEGWLSAGAFWSRDAMHFQATQWPPI